VIGAEVPPYLMPSLPGLKRLSTSVPSAEALGFDISSLRDVFCWCLVVG